VLLPKLPPPRIAGPAAAETVAVAVIEAALPPTKSSLSPPILLSPPSSPPPCSPAPLPSPPPPCLLVALGFFLPLPRPILGCRLFTVVSVVVAGAPALTTAAVLASAFRLSSAFGVAALHHGVLAVVSAGFATASVIAATSSSPCSPAPFAFLRRHLCCPACRFAALVTIAMLAGAVALEAIAVPAGTAALVAAAVLTGTS